MFSPVSSPVSPIKLLLRLEGKRYKNYLKNYSAHTYKQHVLSCQRYTELHGRFQFSSMHVLYNVYVYSVDGVIDHRIVLQLSVIVDQSNECARLHPFTQVYLQIVD